MGTPTAEPWPREAPQCRKCGTSAYPHNGRGLCGACYQWLARRGLLDHYAPLRAHGNHGTDSWVGSPRHIAVYRNHKRLRQAAWARQRRIWQTDGRLIDPARCETLTSPPPRPTFPARSPVEWGDVRAVARAAPVGFLEPWEESA